MKRRLFLLAGPALAGAVSAKAPKAAARVGELAPAFSVADARGQLRNLEEFKGRPVVLEWSSPSCPFAAAQYASGRMPDLQRWSRDKGAAWLTVLSSHPSRSDYLTGDKAQAFNAKRGGAPTALLIDGNGAVGRSYGALTANHMFVIAADGRLAYAGGIDDSESGEAAVVRRSRNHVRAALDELFAGRPVKTPATPPFGCALAYAG
ncbi:redoxin domain-containing protein [Piscinibacter koreensis]|uniref:Redoxin domain-containing protein n=1 Tax=Piscinibacter koreensis TaxID=2742824 RepID=A0A7Y6NTC3_9BURK|nr:redoxin domain-containing protein [Schlegelella koreensis]NUZ08893.1 redoxin domain-containing protein [Schlegelella koreensis]